MKICGLHVYGKVTFIKVNQLRYDSLSQKYQGTSVQVLIALNGIVFLLVKVIRLQRSGIDTIKYHTCKAYVFLLLAEYHLKHIFKEPAIRNPYSYQFPNVPSHKWQNWKVEDGSSILSGLVVKLNNLKYCVTILLVARRRMIIMITTEADNDKRLTWVLNRWEIVWTILFIVFSCKNVKLSFLFVALYLALYAQY